MTRVDNVYQEIKEIYICAVIVEEGCWPLRFNMINGLLNKAGRTWNMEVSRWK